MKIFEVIGTKETKSDLDFDLDDDVIFFINNDPEFYRHKFYPFVRKLHAHLEGGKMVSPKAFAKIAELAYDEYKKKFQVVGLPDNLPPDELEQVCQKLQRLHVSSFKQDKRKAAEEK